MTTHPDPRCPDCGTPASGRYCSGCGRPLAAAPCADCGATLAPNARFCAACGRPAATGVANPGRPAPARLGRPVVLGALLLVVAAAVTIVVARSAGTDSSPPVPVAPDLSSMTPREQFARLADRIERAMAAGDTATVVQFFPMAEAAFGNLLPGDRDADARFHVALLRARIGHAPAALAQADSIAASDSTHLFVDYLRAIVHDFDGDTVAAAAARQDFRAHYATEIATARPEYTAHQQMLEQFLATVPVTR